MIRTLVPLAALALVVAPAVAHADEPVATYALIVGSNAGGPGQADLHFAEDDARNVATVLGELGGVTPAAIDIIVHPTADAVRDRITKLAERVAADATAGRQSRVIFYYSGHARASAIDLGPDQLPLDELRQRLFAIPATLTVVVLDACQSGAFSRVKGAAPAADFSFSSREHLDASGVAVLASSSGSELSQESEQLRSSYFTHNLLVGLRGAGDENGDGQVSLDEAYRYAYHQTLLATAETAVGGQHVTFEADLKGHGEVALSYPRAATSAIILPAWLQGQTLVENKRAHVVVAETYKAKGAAVRIAVAPGDYEVLVRHGDQLSRCELGNGGEVDLAQCTTEAVHVNVTKGGGFERPTRIEVSAYIGPDTSDGYTDNLTAFGYNEDLLSLSAGLSVTGLRQITPRWWVGGLVATEALPSWSHTVAGSTATQQLDWHTYTIAAVARAEQPIGGSVSLYAQLTAGLGIGETSLKGADNMTYDHTTEGPAFSAGAGFHFEPRSFHGVGASVGWQYDYAPVVKDLIGNTHDAGGVRATWALTYGF